MRTLKFTLLNNFHILHTAVLIKLIRYIISPTLLSYNWRSVASEHLHPVPSLFNLRFPGIVA